MKEKDFKELIGAVREAGAVLRGEKRAGRVKVLGPESAGAVRVRLGLSQTQFAKAIGISAATLRNWEQGRRKPSGAARVLLRVAAKHPRIVREAVGF